MSDPSVEAGVWWNGSILGGATGLSRARRRSKRTVLLVIGEPGVRALVAMVLAREYTVLEAGDGLEGLAKAMEQRPDVVITALVLCRMNGVELVEAIRGHPETRRLPVIVISGTENSFAVEKLGWLGVTRFLPQTFALEKLPGWIEEALCRRQEAVDA